MNDSRVLWSYDVKNNKWTSTGIKVPCKANLLCDPIDHECIYGMCKDGILRRIVIDKKEIQIVSNSSETFYLTGNNLSCLVRVSRDEFIVIAQLASNGFYAYSSKNNSWEQLPKWRTGSYWPGQIVADPSIGYLYYRFHEQTNFYSVKLIP